MDLVSKKAIKRSSNPIRRNEILSTARIFYVEQPRSRPPAGPPCQQPRKSTRHRVGHHRPGDSRTNPSLTIVVIPANNSTPMVVAHSRATAITIDATNLKRWTLEEYHRLIELDILQPEDCTKLINGYICTDISAHNPAHAQVLRYAMMTVMARVGQQGIVQYQLPIRLEGDSQPEPDIAVVRPDIKRCDTVHPSAADIFLLIEVASSTLKSDLTTKAQLLCARNGIVEYWVVDVSDRRIWIHRQPSDEGYQDITELE